MKEAKLFEFFVDLLLLSCWMPPVEGACAVSS